MSETANATADLARDTAQSFLHQMLRIRRFEEKCAELYSAQKIRGFMHLYIGEEAVATGVMPTLTDEDAVVATYREHGHALARGLPMNEIMAEMFGKAAGASGGRGGSMHIFSAAHRFYGGNAIVAGGLPLAVGLALADKMQGRNRVTCCFFGEGAAAEGEFQEALNLAALWHLPVLFLCENNLYAMGTALARSESNPSILAHAEVFGIPGELVDGMDVVAVNRAASAATDTIRKGEGPRFIEAHTYRFRAHSMFDPDLYRHKDEIEAWKQKGPVLRFRNEVLEAGLFTEAEIAAMEAEIATEIEAAVAFADAAEWEPVEHLMRHVYAPVEGPS